MSVGLTVELQFRGVWGPWLNPDSTPLILLNQALHGLSAGGGAGRQRNPLLASRTQTCPYALH